MHLHIEVARWATLWAGFAFTGKTNTVAGINTSWNFNREGFVFFNNTLTMAVATGVGDHLATAATLGTGLLHREEALGHTHLAGTTTGGAGYRGRTFARTGAVAGIAMAHSGYIYLYGFAFYGVF
tara:strand:- start:82 stop:456 length:375 start_codon:yes stop_codon:yes gene_type:complete